MYAHTINNSHLISYFAIAIYYDVAYIAHIFVSRNLIRYASWSVRLLNSKNVEFSGLSPFNTIIQARGLEQFDMNSV